MFPRKRPFTHLVAEDTGLAGRRLLLSLYDQAKSYFFLFFGKQCMVINKCTL